MSLNKETKRDENVAMASIDCKKFYGIVPNIWIIAFEKEPIKS